MKLDNIPKKSVKVWMDMCLDDGIQLKQIDYWLQWMAYILEEYPNMRFVMAKYREGDEYDVVTDLAYNLHKWELADCEIVNIDQIDVILNEFQKIEEM